MAGLFFIFYLILWIVTMIIEVFFTNKLVLYFTDTTNSMYTMAVPAVVCIICNLGSIFSFLSAKLYSFSRSVFMFIILLIPALYARDHTFFVGIIAMYSVCMLNDVLLNEGIYPLYPFSTFNIKLLRIEDTEKEIIIKTLVLILYLFFIIAPFIAGMEYVIEKNSVTFDTFITGITSDSDFKEIINGFKNLVSNIKKLFV